MLVILDSMFDAWSEAGFKFKFLKIDAGGNSLGAD